MRAFACAGRRFIAPAFAFYLSYRVPPRYLTPPSRIMRRFNPILSSLTSPIPPFLRRYPFAHVFVFLS